MTVDAILDRAIAENRQLTREEVLTLLQDPTVQDALRDPLARAAMSVVGKFNRVKRKVLRVYKEIKKGGKAWQGKY